EPAEVPAPVDDPARARGDARGHRAAERLPRGRLVAGPEDAVRLRAGEARARERHGRLACRAQQDAEGPRVVHGVAVVALVAAAPVAVAQLVAPRVLAAVGLEPVDVEVLDEVAALRGPPVAALLR